MSVRMTLTVDSFYYRNRVKPVMIEVKHEAVDKVQHLVDTLADLIRNFAPIMKKQIDPRFYPGELRESIYVDRLSETKWEIGARVRYAAFLEFGTKKMAAQPYFRPAIAIIEAWSFA